MSVENKQLVRRLLEDDISRGDEATADAIIDAEFFDHTNPPAMQHGLDGHKAIVRLFRAAFPDMWWQIEDMVAEDDKVVARVAFSGTHLGDFFGIPATGKKVAFGGIHVLRIANGRIAEHWGNNDDMALMRQLGVGG